MIHITGKPSVGLRTGGRGVDLVSPHRYLDAEFPVGDVQAKRILAGRRQTETFPVELARNQGHLGVSALAEKFSPVIDDDPAAVAPQSVGFHIGPGGVHGPDSLDRIEVDGGKTYIHVTFLAGGPFPDCQPPA